MVQTQPNYFRVINKNIRRGGYFCFVHNTRSLINTTFCDQSEVGVMHREIYTDGTYTYIFHSGL